MLRTRLLTVIVLIPILVGFIWRGGLALLAFVALVLTLADVEYCRLTRREGAESALIWGAGGVWLFLLDAQFPTRDLLHPGLALILLSSLAWQLLHHRRTVASWALSVTGGLYIGTGGACFISLRRLPPDGLWWTLTVVSAVIFTDGVAYLAGSIWGRRKLAPRVSHGKTWEGYIAGALASGLVATLSPVLWRLCGGAEVSVSSLHAGILGLLIGVLAPLGDLVVSMIKRQAGVKDSGRLFPGHGGALDRADSALWAAVIGYYYVLWFAP